MYMPSTLRNVNNLEYDCEMQLGVTYKRQDFEWFFFMGLVYKNGFKKIIFITLTFFLSCFETMSDKINEIVWSNDCPF